jgi:hypothetical protein
MPSLTRRTVSAAIFALVVLGFVGGDDFSAREQRRPVSLEYDIDRPGADYNISEIRNGDPEACRAQCASDGRCRAFTFVKAGIQGRFARCYLKTAIPQRRADRCCISGVKQ